LIRLVNHCTSCSLTFCLEGPTTMCQYVGSGQTIEFRVLPGSYRWNWYAHLPCSGSNSGTDFFERFHIYTWEFAC
jgi:hypothetical protein